MSISDIMTKEVKNAKKKKKNYYTSKNQRSKKIYKSKSHQNRIPTFFLLVSDADDTNLIRLEKNEVLAYDLNTTIRSITRAITKFETSDLIRKTNHRGGRTYMINPDYWYNSKTPFVLLAVYDTLQK